MSVSKVVARFKDGAVIKGHTSDFFPNKRDFHLALLNGENITIATDQLKALFFVKDFVGDKHREAVYHDIIAGGGRKLQVTFKDGESVIGYSQGYAPDRIGFFMIPADMNDNNDRIFVVNSTVEALTWL